MSDRGRELLARIGYLIVVLAWCALCAVAIVTATTGWGELAGGAIAGSLVFLSVVAYDWWAVG